MSEEIGLTPSETAFFESGGQTVPDEASSEETVNYLQESEVKETSNESAVEENQEQQKIVEKPEKTVALAALHQARAELKEIREKNAKMEQMFQRLVQEREIAAQQNLPSLDKDPIGYFEAKNHQLENTVQNLYQTQKQFQERQAQEAQEQQFRYAVQTIESEFSKATPDYPDATNFLRNEIYQEALNRGATPEEAQNILEQQVRVMVVSAANTGINPAMLAYQMAQARGFKPKAQESNKSQAKSHLEMIASINKGQSAAKSLSSTGGKGKAELTLEAMAEMDESELEKHWDKLKKLM